MDTVIWPAGGRSKNGRIFGGAAICAKRMTIFNFFVFTNYDQAYCETTLSAGKFFKHYYYVNKKACSLNYLGVRV